MRQFSTHELSIAVLNSKHVVKPNNFLTLRHICTQIPIKPLLSDNKTAKSSSHSVQHPHPPKHRRDPVGFHRHMRRSPVNSDSRSSPTYQLLASLLWLLSREQPSTHHRPASQWRAFPLSVVAPHVSSVHRCSVDPATGPTPTSACD